MTRIAAIIVFTTVLISSCHHIDSNKEMVEMLRRANVSSEVPDNIFSSRGRLKYYDSIYHLNLSPEKKIDAEYFLANANLEMGNEKAAIAHLENVLDSLSKNQKASRTKVMRDLGIAWMRYGERLNCLTGHADESCILPIRGNGIHKNRSPSENAIKIYEELLKNNPKDLESRWLLNIAYQTVGGYPDRVPKEYYLNVNTDDTGIIVQPFTDAAVKTGLDVNNISGACITEDFDNDGFLDVMTNCMSLYEGMHYFHNNGDGTFSDLSRSSGVYQFTGGLNMFQTDYNNDGFKDVFVTRGAWKGQYGEPNSLLRNNGDNTFTDVTVQSGLLSYLPTQTATWADFNNDGWLDLFIGNETNSKKLGPTELFINNGDGTFTESAEKAGISVKDFIKGVTAGDYDNDGFMDIFISSYFGNRKLFRNKGIKNGVPQFENATEASGIASNKTGSFSAWFWDYDNDGWLDVLMAGYVYNETMGVYHAADILGEKIGGTGAPILYRNNHDGTFEDVSEKTKINRTVFAMGSGFGDIDNDGFLDVYFGTGSPDYFSLVPNKLLKNINGTSFADITSASRTGNLQKGHGVCFADLDNDGDQDIYIQMGGAFEGDNYPNALYLNPGQNDNNYINLHFEGVKANKGAVGTRIKVSFTEDGKERSVCRMVNSGSSFSGSPYMQFVGIGKATKVNSVEIKWAGSNTKQTINNLDARQTYYITEGSDKIVKRELKKLEFMNSNRLSIGCVPPPVKNN
jgi:hypothetical protein